MTADKSVRYCCPTCARRFRRVKPGACTDCHVELQRTDKPGRAVQLRLFPLSALIEAAADRHGMTENQLRNAVGRNGPEWRALHERGLTDEAADRMAVKIGMHPLEVWGDAWLDAA